MKAIMRDEQEMKYSGVEYLGFIPNDWKVASAKYFVKISNGSDPKSEGDIPVYGSGKKSFRTCGEYKEGPAVLLGRKGTIDIPQYIDGRYWNVDTAFDVKNKSGYSLRYYYYLSTCFDYKRYSTQTALPSMTQSNYTDMRITLPIYFEQQHISNYLDDRCSKIDAIIAEAKVSIEEYKELKQAVIYEAVTKGLDKNVEMKDSGIEWIGNIPKSWEMKKIKYVADFNPKVTIDYDVNQNVGYVPMDAVKFGYMEPLESAIYKLSTGLTQFQNNDIVMAKVTPCFENGEIAIAENLAQEVGFGSSELFVYRANSINRKFLFYYLQHIGFKEMAASTMTGTGGLKRVSSYFARNAEITYPSVAEQQEIVNYLDKNCEGIDSLITEKQSLIEDLEAYKKSLIYEVITGKRKVVA